MILSNVAIYEALEQGRIVITPEPSPRYLQVGQDSPFDTHSVDLRLAKYLSFVKKGPYSFDLHQPGQPKGAFARFLASVSEVCRNPSLWLPTRTGEVCSGPDHRACFATDRGGSEPQLESLHCGPVRGEEQPSQNRITCSLHRTDHSPRLQWSYHTRSHQPRAGSVHPSRRDADRAVDL